MEFRGIKTKSKLTLASAQSPKQSYEWSYLPRDRCNNVILIKAVAYTQNDFPHWIPQERNEFILSKNNIPLRKLKVKHIKSPANDILCECNTSSRIINLRERIWRDKNNAAKFFSIIDDSLSVSADYKQIRRISLTGFKAALKYQLHNRPSSRGKNRKTVKNIPTDTSLKYLENTWVPTGITFVITWKRYY